MNEVFHAISPKTERQRLWKALGQFSDKHPFVFQTVDQEGEEERYSNERPGDADCYAALLEVYLELHPDG